MTAQLWRSISLPVTCHFLSCQAALPGLKLWGVVSYCCHGVVELGRVVTVRLSLDDLTSSRLELDQEEQAASRSPDVDKAQRCVHISPSAEQPRPGTLILSTWFYIYSSLWKLFFIPPSTSAQCPQFYYWIPDLNIHETKHSTKSRIGNRLK